MLLCIHVQLYKVLFPYTPTKDDELILSDGDYVYVHASDSGHTGTGVIRCNPHCAAVDSFHLYSVDNISSFPSLSFSLSLVHLQRTRAGSLAPHTTRAALVSTLVTT